MRINDDQNSLKAGERGPTLLEDFQLREKIMHFDHERIPERIVNERGSGAHGFFELTESLTEYTKAGFLQTPGTRTPVFSRFISVAGSSGSTDLALVVGMLTHTDKTLAGKVAEGLGMVVPRPAEQLNQNIPADDDPDIFQPVDAHPQLKISKALSMADTVKDAIKTRQIAILAEGGTDGDSLNTMKQASEAAGSKTRVIA